METRPPQFLGFVLGLLIILFFLLAIGWSVYRMGTGDLSLWLVLWVLLPLISLPLLLFSLYRLYGLLTARYSIDRNGLRIRWGLAYEEVPIHQLVMVESAGDMGLSQGPSPGFWWPGLVIGAREIDGLGLVEFFSTRGLDSTLVVQTEDRRLAISPPDIDAFLVAVKESMRMGALHTLRAVSTRPNFALARLGEDRGALTLVILGGLLPILIFGYLLLMVGEMSGQVAFGFDTQGAVDILAPPGRLLLLPMIAGASWLLDLCFGLWLYRTNTNRPLAYVLWIGAVLIGVLLWGAVLLLLGVL